MELARICYILKLASGGLWGSGLGGIEADVVSTTCRHGTGENVLCIPHTYVKGLLRRALEDVEVYLDRFGIIEGKGIVNEIFGPLTPFEDNVQGTPKNIVLAPLFPIRDESLAIELARGLPLSYLTRGDVIAKGELYVEPHVRIDDRVESATIGGLYSELKATPKTIFYGEILFYTDSDVEARKVLRALSIAIASLRLRYAGRKTVVQPKILLVTYRGTNMADDVISFVLRIISSEIV